MFPCVGIPSGALHPHTFSVQAGIAFGISFVHVLTSGWSSLDLIHLLDTQNKWEWGYFFCHATGLAFFMPLQWSQ